MDKSQTRLLSIVMPLLAFNVGSLLTLYDDIGTDFGAVLAVTSVSAAIPLLVAAFALLHSKRNERTPSSVSLLCGVGLGASCVWLNSILFALHHYAGLAFAASLAVAMIVVIWHERRAPARFVRRSQSVWNRKFGRRDSE